MLLITRLFISLLCNLCKTWIDKNKIFFYISKLNLFHTSNSLVSFTYVVFYLLTIKVCSFFRYGVVLPLTNRSVNRKLTTMSLYVLNFIKGIYMIFFSMKKLLIYFCRFKPYPLHSGLMYKCFNAGVWNKYLEDSVEVIFSLSNKDFRTNGKFERFFRWI